MKTTPRRPFRRTLLMLAFAIVAGSLVSANHWPLRAPDLLTPAAKAQPAKAQPSAASGPGVVAYGTVDVDGQILNLGPTNPGTVVELLVAEGQQVKKGDILLRVDDESYQNKVVQARMAVRLAEVDVQKAERGIVQWENLVDQQKAAVEADDKKVEAARAKLATAERAATGAAPLQTQDEFRAAAAEVAALESGAKAQRVKLRGLQASKPTLELDQAKAAIDARKEQVREAEIALDRCKLKAEGDGQVLRLNAGVGSQFGPMTRTPAIVLAPAAPRIVRVELDQEFAGRVSLGLPAHVHDESTGTATWPGKVVRIADAFMTKRNVSPDFLSSATDTKVLECIVELTPGQGPPPKLGQRLRVGLGSAR